MCSEVLMFMRTFFQVHGDILVMTRLQYVRRTSNEVEEKNKRKEIYKDKMFSCFNKQVVQANKTALINKTYRTQQSNTKS